LPDGEEFGPFDSILGVLTVSVGGR
jgi:hypothetical protein